MKTFDYCLILSFVFFLGLFIGTKTNEQEIDIFSLVVCVIIFIIELTRLFTLS
jgi:hypothetical protein